MSAIKGQPFFCNFSEIRQKLKNGELTLFEYAEEKQRIILKQRVAASLRKKERNDRYMRSEKGKLYKQNKNRNRRLKLKIGAKPVSTAFLASLLAEQKYKCALCGTDVADRKLRQLDHIIPISRGGEHKEGNLQWLCCRCNLKKSNHLT